MRAFDGRGAWDQAHVVGEAAGLVRGVAAAIVGQPFDGARQAVHLAEAVLDSGDHQVAHVLGGDAAGGGDIAHGFTITAVDRKGDADLLAIVAADLQSIGAPATVARVDGGPAIVTALLAAPAMPLEQEAMQLHDAVDALWIGRCAPVVFSLAAEQCVDPAVAVGRQIGDQFPDVGNQFGIRQRWSSSPPERGSVAHGG